MKKRLFIYGTLKRDRSQHHRLKAQRFVAEAVTLPEFRLLRLGWYPGLARVKEPSEGREIEGELWEVDRTCLEALDAFEGEEYERILISVKQQGDPKIQQVDSYVLMDPNWAKPDVGISWD